MRTRIGHTDRRCIHLFLGPYWPMVWAMDFTGQEIQEQKLEH